MITEDKVIEIFYMADEYSREFSKVRQKYSLDEGRNDGKRRRNKPNRMSDAEIMVILILFHTGGFRCFKHFYLEYVSRHMRHLFPVLSSYSRFVELEKEVALCLALFIKDVLLGKCTGISFTDSTALRVCHIKRMNSHRTFSGLAQKGKTTMGWFYGFKLHLIINDRGEILNFMITPGNTDDREPLRNERYVQDIRGKLCGDRGYIGKALFEMLFINGIQLVTRVRNNMRNMLMSAEDKILLRKRAVIETVNDELKNIAQIEHSRHRSFNNFIVNILSAIAAYCFFPKKPSVDVTFINDGQLVLF